MKVEIDLDNPKKIFKKTFKDGNKLYIVDVRVCDSQVAENLREGNIERFKRYKEEGYDPRYD